MVGIIVSYFCFYTQWDSHLILLARSSLILLKSTLWKRHSCARPSLTPFTVLLCSSSSKASSARQKPWFNRNIACCLPSTNHIIWRSYISQNYGLGYIWWWAQSLFWSQNRQGIVKLTFRYTSARIRFVDTRTFSEWVSADQTKYRYFYQFFLRIDWVCSHFDCMHSLLRNALYGVEIWALWWSSSSKTGLIQRAGS